MKVGRVSFALSAALLLASSAVAANKGSVTVPDPVTVAGKQLSPGNYNVIWDGTGPNVEVKILKGKNVVATAPGHMVDSKIAFSYDAIGTTHNPDGSVALTRVQFHGKKYYLAIGEEPAQAANNLK
jgi:hypothetical protein